MVRPRKIVADPNQPDWVCYDCGMKHGFFRCGQVFWEVRDCEVCGKHKGCADPKNFGYLLVGWKQREEEDGESITE